MNRDHTRSLVAIVLSGGLVLVLLVVGLADPDGRLAFMIAGGLLAALTTAVGFLFGERRENGR